MEQEPQRRRRDAQATREAILATAEEHFAKYGLAGARIDEISKDAGYNRSLIVHHYFDSKKDLYKAVIRCNQEDQIERLRQIMTPAGFKEEASLKADAVQTFIEEALRLSFNHLAEHPKLVRILAWEAAEGWEIFNGLQSKSENAQWAEEVSSFIRRAQAQGIIRPELDPVMVIANVMGISLIYLLSLPRYQLIFPDSDFLSPEALAHAREQIANLIVHGILVHPKETPLDATGL